MEGVITRTIVIEDYKIINEWRKIYGEKYLPKISDLPDKGFGGVVLEKNGDLFGVCYIYLTNSTIGYLGDAVFNPNCADLIAATYPAGPDPIIITSKLLSIIKDLEIISLVLQDIL